MLKTRQKRLLHLKYTVENSKIYFTSSFGFTPLTSDKIKRHIRINFKIYLNINISICYSSPTRFCSPKNVMISSTLTLILKRNPKVKYIYLITFRNFMFNKKILVKI